MVDRVRAAQSTTDRDLREGIKEFRGGYAYPEVAQAAGFPWETVKSRILDGMIRLRDALGVSHG